LKEREKGGIKNSTCTIKVESLGHKSEKDSEKGSRAKESPISRATPFGKIRFEKKGSERMNTRNKLGKKQTKFWSSYGSVIIKGIAKVSASKMEGGPS